MLKMGIIEPSNSPYTSSIVLVKKQDGAYRFFCDFRKLNSITVFDAEPERYPEELFVKMAGSKYFTKIDLSKGYWQVKMKSSTSSKPLTAFVTSEGLFVFNKMPFWFVNSGATFCRMMRILLKGLEDLNNFLDENTETWSGHIKALKSLPARLREKLTARPTKCIAVVKSVAFLGHVIGGGQIEPTLEKITSIQNCRRPSTKKQVRSFHDLIGHYRNFYRTLVQYQPHYLILQGKANQIRYVGLMHKKLLSSHSRETQ